MFGTTYDSDGEAILTTDDKSHVLAIEFLILVLGRGSWNIAAATRIDDHVTAISVVLITSGKHNRFCALTFPLQIPACRGRCIPAFYSSALSSNSVPSGTPGNSLKIRSAIASPSTAAFD